jgi:nitrogenase subunit NifH
MRALSAANAPCVCKILLRFWATPKINFGGIIGNAKSAATNSSARYISEMARKLAAKPKLTDAERHKRFVKMAREVEAEEAPEAFDKAIKKVLGNRAKGATQRESP